MATLFTKISMFVGGAALIATGIAIYNGQLPLPWIGVLGNQVVGAATVVVGAVAAIGSIFPKLIKL